MPILQKVNFEIWIIIFLTFYIYSFIFSLYFDKQKKLYSQTYY